MGVFRLFLIFFLTWNALIAAPMSIEADVIEYDFKAKSLIANDQVLMTYRNMVLTTNRLHYLPDQDKIHMPDPFTLITPKATLTGHAFNYNYETFSGKANCVESVFGTTFISGREIMFTEEEIVFQDALFTTCGEDTQSLGFNVLSQKLTIFPQFGFLWAENNRLQLKGIQQTLWLPTLVYGASKYGLVSHTKGLPKIGSSPREGLFIKQQMSYKASPEFNGSFDVGYLSNLGVYLGSTAQYQFENDSAFNAMGHYEGRDGYSYLAQYGMPLSKWFLNHRSDSQDLHIDTLLPVFYDTSVSFDISLIVLAQYRKLVHEYRISNLPKARLMVTGLKSYFNSTADLSLEHGQKEEESNTETRRTLHSAANGQLSVPVFSSDFVVLATQLNGAYDHYYTHGSWERLFGMWHFSFPHLFLSPYLAYHKQLYQNGTYFFNHEKLDSPSQDEWHLGLHYKHNIFRVKLDGAYEIKDENWRKLDLVGLLDFECWSIGVAWNTVQSNLGLIISLAPSY